VFDYLPNRCPVVKGGSDLEISVPYHTTATISGLHWTIFARSVTVVAISPLDSGAMAGGTIGTFTVRVNVPSRILPGYYPWSLEAKSADRRSFIFRMDVRVVAP
jgi:hypothetical protein